MNSEYRQAVTQARANLADVKARGADAVGDSWTDAQRELFTPSEIEESRLHAALMLELIDAQDGATISEERLETLERMVDAVLEMLIPVGKTLAVVPIQR